MAVSPATIQVLAHVASRKVQEFSADEQIRIYQALGEALPDRDARDAALKLSKVLSQASALQLEFIHLIGGKA